MADKKAAAKGKSAGPSRLISAMYEVSSDGIKKKNRQCPKCGPGTYMANHKDRMTCGKCGFMEKR
jgi:small subunit ribosomal protein S27Ae